MRKLFYVGLESYNSRYPLQLTEWNRRVFNQRGLDVVYIEGETLDDTNAISIGQVLDAHGRSYSGMSQMMNLVRLMQQGEVTSEDVVYFEDMFQPGIESLPFILDQVPAEYRPRVFVRCLAQSIDPDAFVHVWGMAKWMGLYEKMVNEFVTGVLATNEEMVAHMKIAGWTAPIYNISGSAFGKDQVLEHMGGADNIRPFAARKRRVAFTAGFDQEKQPGFYMDLAERFLETNTDVTFAIFSRGPLCVNNVTHVNRARALAAEGKLEIHENLSKNDYYSLLNDTRVLFNCALQDWVSCAVSEADTLGCNVLYPAYRSFPETFANDPERLYIPWSMDDAIGKLPNLLAVPHHNMGVISDWNNSTIDRVVDILVGLDPTNKDARDKALKWMRSDTKYRDHVAGAKYSVKKIKF